MTRATFGSMGCFRDDVETVRLSQVAADGRRTLVLQAAGAAGDDRRQADGREKAADQVRLPERGVIPFLRPVDWLQRTLYQGITPCIAGGAAGSGRGVDPDLETLD